MKHLLKLLVLVPIFMIGQTQNQNYIITKNYKVASTVVIPNPTSKQVLQIVDYFDGIGRPIQQVASKQAASGGNIITHIEYDSFGNSIRQYLPYKSDNSGLAFEYDALNSTQNYPDYYEQNPYSEKLLQNSQAGLVLKQSAPGVDWIMGSEREIKFDYKTNEAGEVRYLSATSVWNSSLSVYVPSLIDNGSFQAEMLYKTITKDENFLSSNLSKDHTTEEFKDKQGKLILKRTFNDNAAHDTYYVYDQYGNLTFVLPPAVTNITTQLNGLCYQYRYDDKNRLVEKKLPGKEWEFILYDKLDRVVATGPAFNPFSDGSIGWLITKYDIFDRVVYTGWTKGSVNSMSRKILQLQFNSSANISESKSDPISIDGIQVNYTNNVTVIALEIVLTINYYDDYNFPDAPSTIPTLLPDSDLPIASNVKGLSTGSWVRVLDMVGTDSAEKSYTLYDKRYRPVQTHTTNHYGGYTEINSNLNWQGNPLYTLTRHKRTNADAELTVTDRYTYTDQDRVELHTHQINNFAEELIAKNTYDELGQLISKNVGGQDTGGDNGLQKVDYTYNIRGWLTGINNINDITSENDLFAFKINYNKVEDVSNYTGVKLYNGNISETYWRTASDNIIRKYGYYYDSLNRLNDAVYQKPDASIPVSNCYNESIRYDKNGNITNLVRNGVSDNPIDVVNIDDLIYEYDSDNPNRLLNVYDQTPDPNGFKDGLNIGDDYTYDILGNLTIDGNKQIPLIKYNHLNLPTEIQFYYQHNTKINYLYNALGEKVQKSITVIGSGVVKFDYLDGFQYFGNVINFFPTAEGYVKNTVIAGNNNFNYAYNFTDHLGNIRLSYGMDPDTQTLKIMEENHYYPFGLKHTNYSTDLNEYGKEGNEVVLKAPGNGGGVFPIPITELLKYNYKYNGKEYQDELGLNMYDYGWRNYMPDIGRWTTMDPLINDLKFTFDDSNVDEDDEEEVYQAIITKLETAEGIFNTNNLNPYGYGYNNPVSFDDPDGRCPWCIIAFLLYAEFANSPTLDKKQDAINYNASKSNKTLITAPALGIGGAKIVVNAISSASKARAVEKTIEKSKPNKEGSKGGPSAGKKFTPKQKAEAVKENAEKNGGQTKCETCGTKTTPAKKSERGVTPPKEETNVDHVFPRSQGGNTTKDNTQILCRDCNIKKSDKIPTP